MLKEEAVRRKSILGEIIAEQKLQEEKIRREVKLQKKAKKEGVSLSTVQNKMKKLIDKLHNADMNNDITTPSSSDTSEENVTPKNQNILGTRINIVIDETDSTVVPASKDNSVDNALTDTINRVSTPDLLLDVSGNTNN